MAIHKAVNNRNKAGAAPLLPLCWWYRKCVAPAEDIDASCLNSLIGQSMTYDSLPALSQVFRDCLKMCLSLIDVS